MKIVKMSADDLIPETDQMYVEVGLTALLNDLAFGEPLILKGPKGSGKTLAIEQLCSKNGVPMIRENCNSGTDETQLIGSFGMEGTDVHFCLGSLPLAIETANEYGEAFLVLEEINTLRPQVQSMVFSVADYRRAVEAPALGHKFSLKKGASLWVIGTMNPGYSGTYQLNEALRSRFDFIEVGYMPERQEQDLLEMSYKTPADLDQRRFAKGLLVLAQESRTYEWDYALSTRDLVHTIHKAEKLGNRKALKMLLQKFDPEFKEKIEARVQSIFAINLQEVVLYEV
jgi:nitric oxide reductase NorQ protein